MVHCSTLALHSKPLTSEACTTYELQIQSSYLLPTPAVP